MKKLLVLITVIVFCSCAGNKETKVGADRDAHGCIGSAGYAWCEEKQKCLRYWEEYCVKGEKIPACYECEGLGMIKAGYYKGAGADIEVNGQTYSLERALSASGARYTGNNIMIWDKGGNARFELNGREYQCKVKDCTK